LQNVSVELLNTMDDDKEQTIDPDPVLDKGLPDVGDADLSNNVRKIIQFINEHYGKDLSLEGVAECVYLHPNYISSIFKKETGMTFVNYLHMYRMKHAKELMIKDPDVSFQYIS